LATITILKSNKVFENGKIYLKAEFEVPELLTAKREVPFGLAWTISLQTSGCPRQYHAYVETLIKSPKHRKEWEQELLKTFPDEPQPYTDQKFRELIQRWLENKLSKAFPKESKPPYKPKKFKELLRRWWELGLAVKFHSDADATPPPYSDEKFRELTRRWLMRYVHYYLGGLSVSLFQFRQFHFKNFYHPFVCDFAKLVYNPIQGIPSLMSRETQLKNSGFQFANTYRPTPWVVAQPDDPQLPAYPKEEVDFTPTGPIPPTIGNCFSIFRSSLLTPSAKTSGLKKPATGITTSSILWAWKALCPVAH
jgi:hypothetical protein